MRYDYFYDSTNGNMSATLLNARGNSSVCYMSRLTCEDDFILFINAIIIRDASQEIRNLLNV